MKKTAILLMLITILSKIFGFTRDIILSYIYGASNISDAYLISLSIPMVIFAFIGIAVSTGYIPMYCRIEQEYGEEEGNRYTNNIVNILIIICTVIVVFGLLFTKEIVRLFASGFKGETLALAVRFTRISLFGIYFTSLIYIFNGFLQLKGNYIIPALVGFPLNLAIIISIFLSFNISIMVLPIGVVVANASQLLFLLPFVYKKGYRYKLITNMKDKHVIQMIYLIFPVIIGGSVDQINVLVDRTIASSIAVGGISALNYSNRLVEFIQGIFVTSISIAMYPMISKMAVENNTKELKRTISEAINIIGLLVIPATVGSMIFAEPVVGLLFGRGAFDLKAIHMTSSALFFYSIGIIGIGFRDILSRAFYSMQDTKTPMINATVAMTMNIFLNIILSRFMGIAGLALATSISAIFCTVLLFISFRKKLGAFGLKSIAASFLKTILASLIMGAIAKVIYIVLLKSLSANLALISSVGIGAVLYFTIICFMRIEEMNIIVNRFKEKLKIENKKANF
ncbi:murein biosynthesis integral membrane protein MurJ [Proteiniborus sp. MB09-C3]|uniref:murein biosynthesis integral membrane protein MurJ n=1 Tax=Proteiniborus sp. MB09-C3 TaxID=3050072 RepID=UPI002554AF3D|nr:murein biosynthesis integral membrane protein MurJ [Proteiniborus sp. MB09-C3]WIV12074.1 murein biosynthesis integral membrane protein MurJ [Proteiniborus sp. MB09-C3]